MISLPFNVFMVSYDLSPHLFLEFAHQSKDQGRIYFWSMETCLQMMGDTSRVHANLWQNAPGKAKMLKDDWKAHIWFLKEKGERHRTFPCPSGESLQQQVLHFNKTALARLKRELGLFASDANNHYAAGWLLGLPVSPSPTVRCGS